PDTNPFIVSSTLSATVRSNSTRTWNRSSPKKQPAYQSKRASRFSDNLIRLHDLPQHVLTMLTGEESARLLQVLRGTRNALDSSAAHRYMQARRLIVTFILVTGSPGSQKSSIYFRRSVPTKGDKTPGRRAVQEERPD